MIETRWVPVSQNPALAITQRDWAAAISVLSALYFLFIDTNVLGVALSVLVFTFLYQPHAAYAQKSRYDYRADEAVI